MNPDEVSSLLVLAENSRNAALVEHTAVTLEASARESAADVELWYAAGYAWYLHPNRVVEPAIVARVAELLGEVIEREPEHYLALLYLGHNFYDGGDYTAAERYFRVASEVAPKSYIGLKSDEMRACVATRARGVEAGLSELENFANEASDPAYEREDIWPRELARVLELRGRESVFGSG